MGDVSARIDPERLLAEAGWVRALAQGLVAASDVDDVVQETWRVALERPPVLDEAGSNLRGWLATVMRNLARRSRRAERARSDHARRLRGESAADERDAHERVLLQRQLADAVLALDEPYKSAIVLRYFDGLAPREIAARQGVSYDAARQRLSRRLALLRAKLDRDCEGGRGAWLPGCVALVRKASPASALATGGVLVSAKAIAALAVLVVVALTWWAVRSDSSGASGGGALAVVPEVGIAGEAPTRQAAREDDSAARSAVAPAAIDPRSTARAVDRDRDLHGVVLDPEGTPVAGAAIEILQNDFCETMLFDFEHPSAARSIAKASSDARGEFAVALEPGRPVVLRVAAPGLAVAELDHRHAGERVEVRLERGANLFGRVVRARDGTPVAGAAVELWPESRGDMHRSLEVPRTKTDRDGGYRFSALAAGSYYVCALPVGDEQAAARVELRAGLETAADLRVGDGLVLRGRVLDAETGAPIAGAEIGESFSFRRVVQADANGAFEFAGFSSDGIYEIAVRAAGYGRMDRSVRELGEPMPATLEVRLQRARGVTGRVVDATGAPVAGAYVAAVAEGGHGSAPEHDSASQEDWQSARTSADGTFRIATLRADMHHTLYVRHAGFGIVSYQLPDRELAEPLLALEDIVLRPGALVRGRLVDERGAAVADREVQLRGWNGDHNRWQNGNWGGVDRFLRVRTTRSDDLGRFAFADVAEGVEYWLSATPLGSFEACTSALEVRRGEVPEPVVLVLPRGLAISGRVLGSHGEPVRAAVWVRSLEGQPATARVVNTGVDGEFEVDGLAPGEYSVIADPRSLWNLATNPTSYTRVSRRPVAAGAHDLELVVPRASELAGRVVDASGRPAARAVVWIHRDGDPRDDWTLADDEGAFSFWIGDGELVTVEARPAGAGTGLPAARLANAAAGDARIELRLP